MFTLLITLQSPALNYLNIHKLIYRWRIVFMIKLFGNDWFNTPLLSPSRAGFLPGVILMLGLSVAGCDKSKPAPVEASVSPTVEATNPATAATIMAAAPVPTQVVIPASPDGTPDLKAINQAYIRWIVQNRQRPKNFDDFVALSGAHLPPPPAGKKYVIDKNGFINFANQ